MPVSRTLAALGRLVRRPPAPPADLLDAYANEVIPVLDRAEWLYQYWLDQSTLYSDSEKLGNVAAIHRWEMATMGRSLERVTPPEALADTHAAIVEALDMASRAAQLLSSGSRFHNANALCEGQALLTASRERRLAALRSLRRYLMPRPAPPGETPAPGNPSHPPDPSAPAVSTVSGTPQGAAAPCSSDQHPAPPAPSAPGASGAPSGPTATASAPAAPGTAPGSDAPSVADQAGERPAPADRAPAPTGEHAGTTTPAAPPTDRPRRPQPPAPDDAPAPPGTADAPPAPSGWGTLFSGSEDDPRR